MECRCSFLKRWSVRLAYVNANTPNKQLRYDFYLPRKAKDTGADWMLLRSMVAAGVENRSHVAASGVPFFFFCPSFIVFFISVVSTFPIGASELAVIDLLAVLFSCRYELWVTVNARLVCAAPKRKMQKGRDKIARPGRWALWGRGNGKSARRKFHSCAASVLTIQSHRAP